MFILLEYIHTFKFSIWTPNYVYQSNIAAVIGGTSKPNMNSQKFPYVTYFGTKLAARDANTEL